MKRIVTLVGILLMATVFGCKDSAPPKTDTRVESASESARNDDRAIAVRLETQKAAVDLAYARQRENEERQRRVDVIRAIIVRWDAGLDEVGRTPRGEIAVSIKKLQAVMAEIEVAEVDDCTTKARVTLLAAMTTALDALGMFQKETGTTISDATNQKLQLGVDTMANAKREIDACRSK